MSIGIIGTGWGARVQVPAFRAAGLPVVALAGQDAAKTARIAAELEVPFATGEWRALLARDDVRLVSIVTPPDLHAEMAIAALQAGKHVLCEKPTAFDATRARAMLGAAQAHPDRLALIDHELRFLPGVLAGRQLVATGAIGQVRHVLGQVLNSARSDPQRPWNWWSDAARGGGMLGAIASHQIDLVRFLTAAEVTGVAATLATFIDARPGPDGPLAVTADDYYSLRLRLTNGILASLEGSVVARSSEPDGVTLFGSEGTLRWSEGQLWLRRPNQDWEEITPPHRYPLPAGLSGIFPHGTVYLGHALRAALEGDCQPVAHGATFVDGVHIQQALDGARQSHAGGGGFVTLST